MTDRPDLAIVGAGPAGLAAAIEAVSRGLSVTLLDERASPGGIVYHAVTRSPLGGTAVLDADYRRGAALVEAFRNSGATYRPGASVWAADRDGSVGVTVDGQARWLRPRRLLLATGCMERSLPFPGWTLPGVMTAGAGQILLKDSGAIPDGPVVMAGTGPLLLLVAVQYLRAGARIAAVADLTPPGTWRRGLPHLAGALGCLPQLRKGLSMMTELRRSGVRRIPGVTGLRAIGTDRLEAVEVRQGTRAERIPAGVLLVHAGVVPNIVLTRMLRLPHRWDPRQRCWRPDADAFGATALDAIAVAGDGARILGAEAAVHAGRLAALDAAHRLGVLDRTERDRHAAPERAAIDRQAGLRSLLDAMYPPPDALTFLDEDTTICRCEDITATDIRAAIADGCRDPNQVKAVTRCAMGPCQGRQCGQTLARIVADATGQKEDDVMPPRARPPLRRLTIGDLAALETESTP